MEANELKVEVKDTVFDPDLSRSVPQRVRVRRSGTTTLYKVWLYLDGRDLPYVESVTYTLHETFRNPNRTVRRKPSNPNCQLVIWTWGVFTIRATIRDKVGRTYSLVRKLTYDKELPKSGDMYFYEDEDSSSSDRPKLVSA